MTYYVGTMPAGEHLSHHGIKGMKWGQRRYQNPDGSLTAAGRIRYGVSSAYGRARSGVRNAYGRAVSSSRSFWGSKKKRKKAARTAAKVAGVAALAGAAYLGARSKTGRKLLRSAGSKIGAKGTAIKVNAGLRKNARNLYKKTGIVNSKYLGKNTKRFLDTTAKIGEKGRIAKNTARIAGGLATNDFKKVGRSIANKTRVSRNTARILGGLAANDVRKAGKAVGSKARIYKNTARIAGGLAANDIRRGAATVGRKAKRLASSAANKGTAIKANAGLRKNARNLYKKTGIVNDKYLGKNAKRFIDTTNKVRGKAKNVANKVNAKRFERVVDRTTYGPKMSTKLKTKAGNMYTGLKNNVSRVKNSDRLRRSGRYAKNFAKEFAIGVSPAVAVTGTAYTAARIQQARRRKNSKKKTRR